MNKSFLVIIISFLILVGFSSNSAYGVPGTIPVNVAGNFCNVNFDAERMEIQSAEGNLDDVSIIFQVEITGTPAILEITFARSFFDATFEGSDDEFFIIVDGDFADFEEIVTTSEIRTLRMELSSGTEEVEIFGTQLDCPPSNLEVFVDEFPFTSFSGAQVVKVVIDDPNISDIDEGKGEPDVKVNNKKLRMVQGIDGKWYAFFSHRDNSLLADSLVAVPGTGQDFGVFCSNISSVLGVTVTETLGFAIKDPSLVTGSINGDASGIPLEGRADCTDPNPTSTPNDFMNVVNNEVTLAPFPSADMAGQIGIGKGFWAFIQLFLFQINDQVDVTYFVGGTQQTVPLNFVNDPVFGDLDGDGVPDDQDACQGFDDNIDTDKDGIPDGCDPIPELSCGPGTIEVENQCLPDLNQICGQGTTINNMMCVVSIAVGGYFVGIEHSALLLQATQLTAAWMIPVIVSAIGIGIVIARKF